MSLITNLISTFQAIGTDIKSRLVKPIANGFLSHAGNALTVARTITGTANKISVTDGDGVSNNPVISIPDNPVMTGTGSITIPSGSTAQRDTASAGKIRHNSQTDRYEVSQGGNYIPMGTVLQCITGTINATSGTTQLPFDNTAPLITDGFQILNLSITPKSANSKILVLCSLNVHTSSILTRKITSVVWAGNSIIYTQSMNTPANQAPEVLPLNTWFDSTDTTTKTLQIRVGADGTGTTYVGASGNVNLGENRFTDYIVLEVLNV